MQEERLLSKRNTIYLRKLEFGLDAHRMHLGDLIRMAADYDKLVRVELIDPPQQIKQKELL